MVATVPVGFIFVAGCRSTVKLVIDIQGHMTSFRKSFKNLLIWMSAFSVIVVKMCYVTSLSPEVAWLGYQNLSLPPQVHPIHQPPVCRSIDLQNFTCSIPPWPFRVIRLVMLKASIHCAGVFPLRAPFQINSCISLASPRYAVQFEKLRHIRSA